MQQLQLVGSRVMVQRARRRCLPWTVLALVLASAAGTLQGCGADQTSVPATQSNLSLVLGGVAGSGPGVLQSAPLPAGGSGSAGVVTLDGTAVNSVPVASGSTLTLDLQTEAPLSAVYVGVLGYNGYYNVPVTSTSNARATFHHTLTLTLPSTIVLNQFILTLVPHHMDGTDGPAQQVMVNVLPPFSDQPPAAPVFSS